MILVLKKKSISIGFIIYNCNWKKNNKRKKWFKLHRIKSEEEASLRIKIQNKIQLSPTLETTIQACNHNVVSHQLIRITAEFKKEEKYLTIKMITKDHQLVLIIQLINLNINLNHISTAPLRCNPAKLLTLPSEQNPTNINLFLSQIQSQLLVLPQRPLNL